MDHGDSPASSLQSTGDTGQLLQELLNLQKSNALSTGSLNVPQGTTLNQISDSTEVPGSGDGTNPTLAELMMTMYDNPVPRQLITLQGSDTANSFSVYGREVEIITSKPNEVTTSQAKTGSNKVKTTPVVKFEWDPVYYVGNLVILHRLNVYAAYSLRGKSGGVVRIINRKTAERALLKDLTGRVVDIAFAYTDDVILAAVDEIGNLLVHSIKEGDDKKIQVQLLLKITRPRGISTEYHRVIWCPFIPDDCDDSSATESSSTQDASRVLVLIHSEKSEIWNIDMVTREHGSGPLSVDDVENGLIRIDSHTKAVMDAAFSPDGTALATASLDGEVKFFQVNMSENTSPRCLHQWKPHDGKPLSSLFFLDDHRNSSADTQFWRFAITGACNNQEIKIWSCESWVCLQTLRFMCPPDLPTNFSAEPCMKAGLDLSAKYLVLSDIKRQVLYVLQIHQDSAANTAHVSSVSEFLLAQTCLSFAILDASKKKFKKVTEEPHLDDITTGELDKEEGGEDGESKQEVPTASGVQIKLYTVHPKALQELLIRFRPESSAPPASTPSVSTISHDDTGRKKKGLQDGLSDMSFSLDSSRVDSNTSIHHEQPVLLTPEAFTSASPRKDLSTTDPIRASGSSTSSFTQVTGLNEEMFSPHSSGDQSVLSEGSTITQTPTDKDAPSPGMYAVDLTPTKLPQTGESLTSIEEVTPEEKPSALQKVSVDDLFDSARQSLGQTLDSAESQTPRQSIENTSSTTGFEVGQLGAQKLSTMKESYDENDEEVAEVLGESYKEEAEEEEEEEEEVEESLEGGPQSTQPFEEHSGDMESDPVPTSWPRPPDVSTETQEMEDLQNEDVYTEDDDVVVEEEEEESKGENYGKDEDTGNDMGNLQEGSSEEIEEQIDEQNEDLQSPKEAPVALPVAKAREIIKEIHTREIIRENVDKEAISFLNENIQSILAVLEAQNSKIESLQYQLAEQQARQSEIQRQQGESEVLAQQPQNIEERLGKLEVIVTSRVERMFNQHTQKENQRVRELLQQTEQREKQRQDRLQQVLVQSMNNAVASNMERVVRQEMASTILPNVTRILEPVKEQMHQEIAQKLTATDSIIKDSIGKMVRSKQTIEALGVAAGNVLQTPIQLAYREAFQNIVVPSFDRAMQNIFQQVNEVFVKGTKETTKHLDTHLIEIREKHVEARDPIIAQLRKLTDSFQSSADSMKQQVLSTLQSRVNAEIQSALANLEETIVRYVRQAVKEEVSIAVREQGASISDSVLLAMRSGAVTPVQVTPDPHQLQTQILNLLRQGQLNAAFQQALSASNLDLVVFVCETVNPSQVFNQSPCPLQQPVLLSLIQQLSADIGNNTELKHKYLEEAVMNLDTSNPVTQGHMRGVLLGLIQKLKTYITANPNDKTTRSLRMLQMASESLLK
ncbi:enhancer of mRNA-decapping protein 4-like isoform X1 [Crassostrea virginica]